MSPRKAVFFVVNKPYASIAINTARNLKTSSRGDIDFFVFTESDLNLADPIVKVLAIVEEDFKINPNTGKLPNLIFARIWLPKTRLANYDLILYLDADIAVHGPIDKLFDQFDTRKSLAAVKDIKMFTASKTSLFPDDYEHKFGIEKGLYFNAGVILFNNVKYREIDLQTEISNFFSKFTLDEIKLNDQDILNYIFADDWKPLSISWNYQYYLYHIALDLGVSPRIIHYNEERKPWHDDFMGDDRHINYFREFLGKEDFEALRRTSWRLKPLKVKLRMATRKVPVFSTLLSSFNALKKTRWRREFRKKLFLYMDIS